MSATKMNKLLDANEAQSVIEAHYKIDPIVYCMLIRRGFNDTYLVSTEHKKYIFRVYLNNKYFVESDSAYKFETELLEHLHVHGVPVSRPIRNKHSALLGHIETEFGERTVAMFDYADGMVISHRAITLKQAYNYGEAMANLHLTANSFVTEHERYSLDSKYLIEEPVRLIEEVANLADANSELKELVQHGQQILEKLQPLEHYVDSMNRIGTDGDKFGIIHADLHTGNVHFHGESLTLFDFDHCAYGWRAYDLAIAHGVPKAHRDAVYAGYESRRILSDVERDSIQDFANLRNLWDIGDILATVEMRAEPPEHR